MKKITIKALKHNCKRFKKGVAKFINFNKVMILDNKKNKIF